MKAYFIANITVTNPEAFKEYQVAVPPTIAAYGGRYLIRGGAAEQVEGDWMPNRIVVLEFPDKETAKKWYNSPEYQKVLSVRLANATGSAILVEGIDPSAFA
ncbi:MAG: DUF1330 domain-containing protein [Alphaproteobacteria bacterium]|uniref:DUF1330 domain-containing protein n=1 Tax=Pacificispira sp. TaxID=2888761 RepID=UPI001B14AFBB|nr:DUF1330 domain-containing protein [Alphaproteobacteria bacterium]MBO6864438.1 DUF1330 domain-containing protein [Alphaproteobacteria bacterium]MEC9266650.1 DUF1330 domain-containing protein [Pseudomonadota bacterium]